jgi:aryl-alcohol dehydrogenase-like predicted oxidoreductase
MERRRLGGSGVEVTRMILGCGNFGGIGSAPEFFGRGESEDEALALMDAAWELGVRAFDTADAYGGGRSEQAIGRWLRERGRRSELTLATKVFHSVTGDPHDRGLAPDRIRGRIEDSLARLGVERVDQYLIHEPDPGTPLERTLEALTELVGRGTVGAIGASNADGPFLEEALEISERRGLARFEWVQNSYSLLDREAEREVLPLCAEHGLGFTPFSPLAGGWLTGKYRRGETAHAGSRMTLRPGPYAHLDDERVYSGLERLEDEARRRNVSPAGLSLAWLLAQPQVDGVVVGPRRPAQLEPAREALALPLDAAERDEIASFFPC